MSRIMSVYDGFIWRNKSQIGLIGLKSCYIPRDQRDIQVFRMLADIEIWHHRFLVTLVSFVFSKDAAYVKSCFSWNIQYLDVQ